MPKSATGNREKERESEWNAPGIVVIFNQFTEQIFYEHIFRDNRRMFVLKIFKYLHCEIIVDVHEDADDKRRPLWKKLRDAAAC